MMAVRNRASRFVHKRMAKVVVLERSDRHMVEVAPAHGPLVNAMKKVPVKVTAMPGRMLGRRADQHGLYVCGECSDQGAAVRTVERLIDQTSDDTGLRKALRLVGIPHATQVGDTVMVWWPNVVGRTHSIH